MLPPQAAAAGRRARLRADPRGYELEPVLLSLGRWGSGAPLAPDPPQLGVDALAVALKTTFDPPAAHGVWAGYELHMAEHRFTAQVDDGSLELRRGECAAPDVVIETDPGTLAAMLWHGLAVEEAMTAGTLAFSGDRRALRRFLRLFPVSVPAAAG